ncbi:MAG: DUF1273 family protein [Oscillospiraceae bacterium]|nr:DUF1273 family protein [Oscillospiraceae bacterium]
MQHNWIYDKNKTVCFSGHRPEKLPDRGSKSSMKIKGILSMLYFEIHESIRQGYNTFIVGGARGIDLWAAEYIMQLKHQGNDINLVTALPYKNFGENYSGMDLFLRGNALGTSSDIITVSDSYSPGCFNKRNQFMVDHSSRLIAVVSDYKSGTGQTIRYAEKSGIETKIINALRFSNVVDECLDSDVTIVEEKTEIQNLVKIYYST